MLDAHGISDRGREKVQILVYAGANFNAQGREFDVLLSFVFKSMYSTFTFTGPPQYPTRIQGMKA